MAYGKLSRRQSKRRAAQNARLINELASLSYEIHAALPLVWYKMEALQRENMNLKASLQGREAGGVSTPAGGLKKGEAALQVQKEVQAVDQPGLANEQRKQEVMGENAKVHGENHDALEAMSRSSGSTGEAATAPAQTIYDHELIGAVVAK